MNLKLAQTLLSLQNSKVTQIPEFAEDQLNLIKQQLKRLNDEIKAVNEDRKTEDASTSAELVNFRKAKFALLLDQVYRIKRFLLIYFNFRCDRIEDQFWMFCGDLNNSEKGNLSQPEKEYFGNYKDLVNQYSQQVEIDLINDLDPPLEPEVEVRILKDCGEILNANGEIVKLQKNSCIFMKRKDIEKYVKQGYAVIKR